MDGQFYITTSSGKSYVADILSTFNYNNNTYAVFSFENNELININIARVTSSGHLQIITDENEKQEVFEFVKGKIIGG